MFRSLKSQSSGIEKRLTCLYNLMGIVSSNKASIAMVFGINQRSVGKVVCRSYQQNRKNLQLDRNQHMIDRYRPDVTKL